MKIIIIVEIRSMLFVIIRLEGAFYGSKGTEGAESCIGKKVHSLCHGDYVEVQGPPLLFDITEDPSESFPIDEDKPDYKEVKGLAWVASEDGVL